MRKLTVHAEGYAAPFNKTNGINRRLALRFS